MIDNVKIIVNDVDPNVWLNSDYLNFKEKIEFKTNRRSSRFVANYNCLRFTVYESGLMMLQGSLHKYCNILLNIAAPKQHSAKQKEQGFNGNDFAFSQFLTVLNDLENKFDITHNNKLQNLEFGVNIELQLACISILNGLLFHKGKVPDIRFNGHYKEFKHQRYSIKVYDKSIQYGMVQHILRIECKYKKMHDLRSVGIYSLHDLTDLIKLNVLRSQLLQSLENIFFFDNSIDSKKLTKVERQRLKDYCNTDYWLSMSAKRRDRHKKRYARIVQEYSQNQKQSMLTHANIKWMQLCNN